MVSHFFTYFAVERVPCVLLCGALAPCLIGKIEALCSFLQGGNLRNFNHCKECLETARVLQRCSKTNEDGHSGFTHYCVELLFEHHLICLGNSQGPHLEDVDIQFHASCVNIIAFVWD